MIVGLHDGLSKSLVSGRFADLGRRVSRRFVFASGLPQKTAPVFEGFDVN